VVGVDSRYGDNTKRRETNRSYLGADNQDYIELLVHMRKGISEFKFPDISQHISLPAYSLEDFKPTLLRIYKYEGEFDVSNHFGGTNNILHPAGIPSV
jgi:hypothetical protein